MTKPFLIRHRDGREYELADADAYVTLYQPHGFAIVDPQPSGYERPHLGKKASDGGRTDDGATGDGAGDAAGDHGQDGDGDESGHADRQRVRRGRSRNGDDGDGSVPGGATDGD